MNVEFFFLVEGGEVRDFLLPELLIFLELLLFFMVEILNIFDGSSEVEYLLIELRPLDVEFLDVIVLVLHYI